MFGVYQKSKLLDGFDVLLELTYEAYRRTLDTSTLIVMEKMTQLNVITCSVVKRGRSWRRAAKNGLPRHKAAVQRVCGKRVMRP